MFLDMNSCKAKEFISQIPARSHIAGAHCQTNIMQCSRPASRWFGFNEHGVMKPSRLTGLLGCRSCIWLVYPGIYFARLCSCSAEGLLSLRKF